MQLREQTTRIQDRFPTVQIDDCVSGGRAFCDMQIHCVIKFDGKVDDSRLAKAMRLSVDAEPILGCCLVEGFWQQSWRRRSDIDATAMLTLLPRNVEEDVLRYLAEPVDPNSAPLVQGRIFRGEADTLVVKVSHIASDAAGVIEYCELLGQIYTKLGEDPAWRPTVNLSASRSIHQVTDRLSINERLKLAGSIIRDYIDALFPPKNWAFPVRRGAPDKRKFIVRHISGSPFEAAKGYAKAKGYSMNDVLVAAFYRALYTIIEPPAGTPLRLGTTVNLRRYLPDCRGEAICNLAGMFLLRLHSDNIGPDLEHTIHKVHAAMNRRKRGGIGLEDKRYFLFDLKFLPFRIARTLNRLHQIFKMGIGPKSVCPWVTNMGQIGQSRLRFDKLAVSQAYLTAPVAYFPLFIVGISGFARSITISCGFCQTVADRDSVERLFQLVAQELNSLSLAPPL